MIGRLALAALIIIVGIQAQGVPKDFDVVTVRRLPPNADTPQIVLSEGGTFEASDVTLQMLIQDVYELEPNRIAHMPQWLAHDRWLIRGHLNNFPGTLTRRQAIPLIKHLIHNYYSFDAHIEQTAVPALRLTAAPTGRYRRPSTAESGRRWIASNGWVAATGIDMSALCSRLSSLFNSRVIDDTHLDGTYDLFFTLSPPRGQGDERLEVASALSDYLGLVLVPGTESSSEMVIDSVAPPAHLELGNLEESPNE